MVAPAGSTSFENGRFTVMAGGTDLWETSDDFRFVYQDLTGDGEIVANITGLTIPAGAGRSQAAVMIREKLTGDSIHASMMISTDGKAKFRRRTTEGGLTSSDGPSIGTTYPPAGSASPGRATSSRRISRPTGSPGRRSTRHRRS